LGENVVSPEKAKKAADQYVELLNGVEKGGYHSNVSLKLTQMGLDISDHFCLENVSLVIETAKRLNNFVRIDMEGSAYTDRILNVFLKLREKFTNVGIVLQAYLMRTSKDLDAVISAKASVRICKGAYKEPANIAWQKMDDIRQNYVHLIQKCAASDIPFAIATHDVDLIKKVKADLLQKEISRDRYEFQVLYGIRNQLMEKLRSEGFRARIYVPYGSHWLPYFYRRIRERKENLFFVAGSFFHK
jgi:proline dehydrogenase